MLCFGNKASSATGSMQWQQITPLTHFYISSPQHSSQSHCFCLCKFVSSLVSSHCHVFSSVTASLLFIYLSVHLLGNASAAVMNHGFVINHFPLSNLLLAQKISGWLQENTPNGVCNFFQILRFCCLGFEWARPCVGPPVENCGSDTLLGL